MKTTDKIFLLSVEEYEKHKDAISCIPCMWWVLERENDSWHAALVESVGDIFSYADSIGHMNCAVRPALRLKSTNLEIGARFVEADFPWVVIGDGLAIAEMPIAFHRYDANAKKNSYETSEIRQFLLDWYEERTKG